MSNLIAFSHVGCNGDALYALPTIRKFCDLYKRKADFYTTPGCAPLKSIMEAQECINEVFVTDKYFFDAPRIDMPWKIGFTDIPKDKYFYYRDLSFRSFPDRPLPEFIAHQAEMEGIGPVRYDLPNDFLSDLLTMISDKYLVMAPRADRSLGFLNLFNEIAERSEMPVLIVGRKGEMISHGKDFTGLNMLGMAQVISRASGYIGLLSAPLVIATGFPIKKAVVFDGHSWDPRHVIRDEYTKYLINPTEAEVLEVFK